MLLFKDLQLRGVTYNKNPFSSGLGVRILAQGIDLLAEVGMEHFTFKKLAQQLDSTEASVYRYFANKHMFLVFVCNLYWQWLEEAIRDLSYAKLSHYQRLEKAIELIVSPTKNGKEYDLPLNALINVIVDEGPKVYLTKDVDEENRQGVYLAYKTLCSTLAQFMLNVNPSYPFSHSMATTIIEAAHDQKFFSTHLPRLTDIDQNDDAHLTEFLIHTVASALH